MATVLPFIQQNLEYIETIMDSLGQDEQNECLLKAKNDIIAQIMAETKCTSDAATQIIKSIQNSHFRAAERKEIARAVHSKFSASAEAGYPAAATNKSRQSLQSCSCIHRYIPAKVWEKVRDKSLTTQGKLLAALDFAFSGLGISNANETTLLNLLASTLLASCEIPDMVWQVNQADAFTMLHEMKAMAKAMCSRGKLPHHGKVLVYPA